MQSICFSAVCEKDELSSHESHQLPKLRGRGFQGLVQLLGPFGDSLPGPDGTHAKGTGNYRNNFCQFQIFGKHFAKSGTKVGEKVSIILIFFAAGYP